MWQFAAAALAYVGLGTAVGGYGAEAVLAERAIQASGRAAVGGPGSRERREPRSSEEA